MLLLVSIGSKCKWLCKTDKIKVSKFNGRFSIKNVALHGIDNQQPLWSYRRYLSTTTQARQRDKFQTHPAGFGHPGGFWAGSVGGMPVG